MDQTEDILFERIGPLGVVTLNRPKALNALTMAMMRAFDRQLALWAPDDAVKAVVVRGAGGRAFCAGGDVVQVCRSGRHGKAGTGDHGRLGREMFRVEYTLDHRTRRLPKPYIALVDGFVMGGGVGVSVHGSHRLVTERTQWAMPETLLGIFPDVGTSYVLSRLPDHTGIWLGLTGSRLGAADLLALGLADAFVPHHRLPALVDALAGADWTGHPHQVAGAVIADLAEPAGPPPLAPLRAAIARCFGFDRVEEILAALARETSDWARQQIETLGRMSPTSLKLTLRELRTGGGLDFEGCLAMEYRLSQAVMARVDFYEGVRALLVDKDRTPIWQPATLAEVSDAMIEAHFVSLGDDELVLRA
ncbi:MAG: enoyl-CoA hydratase/isomerase family protein [Azospirillum sp.]|nr:enoyl-CoA hydratase/isomerase family protein [Azospirillum sp.]